jgi:hypothetical protein
MISEDDAALPRRYLSERPFQRHFAVGTRNKITFILIPPLVLR